MVTELVAIYMYRRYVKGKKDLFLTWGKKKSPIKDLPEKGIAESEKTGENDGNN